MIAVETITVEMIAVEGDRCSSLGGGQLTIAVEVITLEVITVETIAVETITVEAITVEVITVETNAAERINTGLHCGYS